MYAYKIPNPKGTPKAQRPALDDSKPETFTDPQSILNRHLGKCYFKVGDSVKLKRPKRPRREGVIKSVCTDAFECAWSHGDKVPLFITLEIKIPGGVETKQVGVKQIIF